MSAGTAEASVWHQKSEARNQSALCPRTREIAMDRPRFRYLYVLVMLKRESWEVDPRFAYCFRVGRIVLVGRDVWYGFTNCVAVNRARYGPCSACSRPY